MNKFCDAFISYGRADSKAFATKLHGRLLEEGFKVWFDQNDIPLGVDFQNQIDDGIEKAHNFLFLIAPHSINSPYCGKEIELALKRNKRIIPLLHVEQITQEIWQQINPKDTPQEWEAYKQKGLHSSFPNMHPAIGKINWVYFREGIDDFEKSFAGLINLLRSHANYVEEHTRFLAYALEWERHQKQTSCLLIGEERQQAEAWLKIRFKDEQAPCVPSDLHCEYITESIKNANNLMTQVFISYADADRATMEKIRNSLRRESITVWTNRTDIQTGEAFDEAIKRGIEQADNIVYLLSPDAVNSNYCQRELDLAVSLNKRIIPVLVRSTDSMPVPNVLRDLQYIDLTDNVKEDDYLLDESQLLRILHEDAPYYNEHKILLTKALKWKRQHSNPSILLRGYNLRSAETWLKVANKRTLHPPIPLIEEFIDESLRQPPAESLDVFVSYSRADADFARKLNDELQLQGKRTWFDQESIASGADFAEEIKQGIQACDNFLFILSPRSVNSPYCAEEVEYAAQLNKRFVTLLHRQVNSDELHPELAKVQWIDFKQNEGDFQVNFRQLVRTLDTDREHLRHHTKWSQRALEWKEKNHSADLLLRGSEFLIAQNWLQETEQQKKKPVATPLQKAFIEASKNAIAAAEESEKHRQAEMLRLQEERTKEAEARLAEQKKSLVAVSMLLVAAVGVSVWAFSLWKRAEIAQIKSLSLYSVSLSDSNRQFDALIEAIKAGRQLQKHKGTESIVLTALQAAVYGKGFRERNRLTGHQDDIHSLAFSPDGKMIASGSADNTIKLWNLEGKELHTLKGHKDWVISIAFSPDGKTIATASWDGTAKLWNPQGQELHTFKGHQKGITSVAFSPDGKMIASGSADKTIKLWNPQGQELHTFKGHENKVRSVAFSPDGKTIASASEDKTIKLWNLQGKELHTLKGHESTVYSVAFSSDGKTIASASADKTVRLWNLQGKELHTLKGHEGDVHSLAFSPDGKMIASASWDRTIKLWNLQGQELYTLSRHEDGLNCVTFSPDGKSIAAGSWDSTVELWNRKDEELQTLKGHESKVRSVAFSPDGKTIATASEDKTVKLWNSQGQELHTLTGHESTVRSVAFSPDGKTIATASEDKTVKLWNPRGQELHTLTGHQDWVTSVAFSPDGKTIATASNDSTVKLWNPQGQELHTLTGHKDDVQSLAFSPDGKMIASASNDSTVKLWNLEGKELQTLKGHKDDVYNVAFSPDGKMIASGSRDKTVKLWNLQGKELQTLNGHKDDVYSLAFSLDGKTIASASADKTVKLWNIEGQELQTLKGHEEGVTSVTFSPDGKTIASGSGDKTVILWNLADLTLDPLMQDACAWVGDYLKNNDAESDKHLCDNVEK